MRKKERDDDARDAGPLPGQINLLTGEIVTGASKRVVRDQAGLPFFMTEAEEDESNDPKE